MATNAIKTLISLQHQRESQYYNLTATLNTACSTKSTDDLNKVCKESIPIFSDISKSIRVTQKELSTLGEVSLAQCVDQIQALEQSRFHLFISFMQKQIATLEPVCTHGHDHHHHSHGEHPQAQKFPSSISHQPSPAAWVGQSRASISPHDTNARRQAIIHNYLQEGMDVNEYEALRSPEKAVEYLEDPNNNDTKSKIRVQEAYLQQVQDEQQHHDNAMELLRAENRKQFKRELFAIDNEINEALEELQSEYTERIMLNSSSSSSS